MVTTHPTHRKRITIDRPLLYVLGVLIVAGFLILASASIAVSEKNFGTITYYTFRQLLYGGCLGTLALLLTSNIPYRHWKRLSVPLMLLSFVLLALLFIPQLSFASGGARRWLRFGSFTFQPSEILKLTFIIYLAGWLDARKKEVQTLSYGFIPFTIMLSIVGVFLIMQPDIDMLGLILLTSGILYFLGGGRIAQIGTLVAFGGALLFFLIRLAPYRLSRFTVFLNPGLDPQGAGYQISQALIAIGSGGFFGLGFGRSLQKYNYLPESIGDSIFAIYAEEMGFFGVLLLIGAFMFFLWRGILVAKNAPDMFGKLLAAGITISITLQAFINIAAISGLIPLSGITLPFISYGGTSLVITLASVGILLNISRHTSPSR